MFKSSIKVPVITPYIKKINLWHIIRLGRFTKNKIKRDKFWCYFYENKMKLHEI